MAEIGDGEIISPKEVERPLDLAHNLDQAINALEKLRRAAINSGEAMKGAISTTEVKALTDSLIAEQSELKKVNQELQRQIQLMSQGGRQTDNIARGNKQFQKGFIDLLKDIRIGGVSVGQVLDKVDKANTRIFSNVSKGYLRATVSAKLFGTAARTALTLTGIGIIIAVLATIVTHWDDIRAAIGLADSAHKKFYASSKKDLDEYNIKVERQLELMGIINASEKDIRTVREFGLKRALRLEEQRLDVIVKELKVQLALSRIPIIGNLFKGGADTLLKEFEEIKKNSEKLKFELDKLAFEEIASESKSADEKAKLRKKAGDAELKEAKRIAKIKAEILEHRAKREFDIALGLEVELAKLRVEGNETRNKIAKDALKDFEKRLQDESKIRKKNEETAQKKGEEDYQKELARKKELAINTLNVTADVFGLIDQALDQSSKTRLDRLQKEEDALEKHYNNLIKLAGDNLAQRSELENEFQAKRSEIEKKRRAENRKTAIQEKAMAILSIVINTARAVVELLAKPALAIAAAIVGAAQLAIVTSQKIPAYKGGTLGHPGGLAKVGEEGPELYFNPRTGKGGITPGHATYMNLDRDTVVVPNKQTMRAVALAGLEGHNTSPIYNAPDKMGLYFRELNSTILNKKGIEINMTEEGFRQAFKNGQSKEYLLKTIYK